MNKIVKTGLCFLYTAASALTASTAALLSDPAPEYQCNQRGMKCDFLPSSTAKNVALSTFAILMTGGAIYFMSADSEQPNKKHPNTPGSSTSKNSYDNEVPRNAMTYN